MVNSVQLRNTLTGWCGKEIHLKGVGDIGPWHIDRIERENERQIQLLFSNEFLINNKSLGAKFN